MKSYIFIGITIILIVGVVIGYIVEGKGSAQDKRMMSLCIEKFGGSDAPPCVELVRRYHDRGLR